jgi:hypothetical protein
MKRPDEHGDGNNDGQANKNNNGKKSGLRHNAQTQAPEPR